MRKVLWVLAAVPLAGCLGLNSVKLPVFDSGSWNAADAARNTVSSSVPIEAAWWTQLGDPVLDELVSQTLVNSPDLKAAVARVEQARGQRGMAQATLYPQVDANAGASRTGLSANTSSGGRAPTARTNKLYDAGFDASWEIDIFGFNRHGAEAARANLSASRADAEAVKLGLIAEVVRNYVDLRATEQRVQLAEANSRSQAETLRLIEARYRAGDINGLDLAAAQTAQATVAANVPLLNQQHEALRTALAVLAGVPPTTFAVSDSAVAMTSLTLPPVPAGLPATLLERRADVVAAAQRVRASTALINQAETALLPSFSLTASTGVASSQLANLFASGSGVWGLGLAVTQPIFHAGATLAAIRERKGAEAEVVANYQKTVLVALQDVDLALNGLTQERVRQGSLAFAATAGARNLELSDKLYKAGEVNYLSLLEAQRSSYASADAALQSRASLTANWVALVKALGGGYTAP
ncbi:MAG TPA: efflux transporter outer membrane subunit [Alphaproteobacteria bacterium]|nr:efflux transporter outer membrane subunit [Alphaproteobacteria bacterium]